MAEIHLAYGNYAHAPGECQVAISREPVDGGGGRPIGYMERWDVVGVLYAADQSSLTSAIASLVAAYVPGKTIGFYYEGGAPTGHVLANSSTRDGNKILKYPGFNDGGHAEYSCFRSYSLAVGGLVPLATYSVVKWEESIQWRGTGGMDWGIVVGINAMQAQTFRQRTPVTIVQRGRATGNGSYPTPSSPIWPNYEHLPSRMIELRRSDWNNLFETSWEFTFHADYQLPGRPNGHV
jgi:hypothetical protein